MMSCHPWRSKYRPIVLPTITAEFTITRYICRNTKVLRDKPLGHGHFNASIALAQLLGSLNQDVAGEALPTFEWLSGLEVGAVRGPLGLFDCGRNIGAKSRHSHRMFPVHRLDDIKASHSVSSLPVPWQLLYRKFQRDLCLVCALDPAPFFLRQPQPRRLGDAGSWLGRLSPRPKTPP
jgi:hypothetical protein